MPALLSLALLALLGSAFATPNPNPQQLPLINADLLYGNAPPTKLRDDLLSLHRSLVEVESITYHETEVGHHLARYLRRRGYTTQLQYIPSKTDSPDENRFNVLAWPGDSARPNPRVIISSHIDVVPPYIPYYISDDEPTSDTVIGGRGSVDAKGSIAAQIIALQSLLDAGEVREEDVMLLFVVGEESPGDGMRHFSNSSERHALNFESVIFGEPTENKLACGHKGGLFCSIEASGISGHSGYPWLGKSANELLIKALYEMINTDLGSSDKFGNTTVNIGRIDGGVAANVIPDHAKVDLAIRVAIGPEDEGGEIVVDRIKKILYELDPESLKFAYTHGYGVVECDCAVPGNVPPFEARLSRLESLLISFRIRDDC